MLRIVEFYDISEICNISSISSIYEICQKLAKC